MVREIDPTWEHSVAIDGNRIKIKCNLCNKTRNGGITRFKQSTWPMSRAMWQGGCPNVSKRASRRDEIASQTRKTKKSRDSREKVTRS